MRSSERPCRSWQSPFKDLLVPVDDTDWDLALVGYELEKDKWINLERLLQNAEHNAKYRLDTARQDVLSWVGRLYRAAMGGTGSGK